MNTLILDKLVLTKFRGIDTLTVEANGKDISLCGGNELGKTTTGDSITWLLFGKDMLGRGEKKFSLKTLDKEGKEISHIDHSVEGFFRYNGNPVVLKKILKEKHTKKRGEAKKTFTGNVTEYYIDDLKTTAGKFDQLVSEITDEQTFKLLTVPFFFSEGLKWEKRREILLDICGDVSDDDIIAGSSKMVALPGILKGKKAEDYMVHLKDSRKKVNEQLDLIPTRIDENSRTLPDISGIDHKAESTALVNLNKDIGKKQESLASIKSGGASAELKESLSNVKERLAEHSRVAADELAEKVRLRKNALSDIEHGKKTAELEVKTLETKLGNLVRDVGGINTDLSKLSTEYDEILAVELADAEAYSCPECTQVVPLEVQQSIYTANKIKTLEGINDKAAKLKEDKVATEGQIAEVKEKGVAQEKIVADLTTDLTVCAEELKKLEDIKPLVLPSTDECNKDMAEKDRLEGEIEKASSGQDTGLAEKVAGEITALEEKRTIVYGKLALITTHANTEKRNDELKKEEQELAEKFETIESELFLIEEFIKAKVYSLGIKVAAKFGDIRFKLFDQAINGGVTPCCEVLVKNKKGVLVPFGSANNAARVNTGIKIINSLSKHYEVTVPIVADFAESINNFEETEAQLIKLVVTQDEELIVK